MNLTRAQQQIFGPVAVSPFHSSRLFLSPTTPPAPGGFWYVDFGPHNDARHLRHRLCVDLALFITASPHSLPPTPPSLSPTRKNNLIMSTAVGTWTADELMHGKTGVPSSPPSSPAESALSGSKKSHARFSVRKLGHGGKKPRADPMDWGMPGHLTEEEVAIFVSCVYYLVISCVCVLDHCARFIVMIVYMLWRKTRGDFCCL